MNDKKMEPMDPGAREGDNPGVSAHTPRVAYALKTLVAEVLALFPETPVEYSHPDGRNTQLGVTFDLTALPDEDDRENFSALLRSVRLDARVEEVRVYAEEMQLYVQLFSRPRTQDDRSTFSLGDIWLSMADEDYTVSEHARHESWCDGTQGCGMAGCASGFSFNMDDEGSL